MNGLSILKGILSQEDFPHSAVAYTFRNALVEDCLTEHRTSLLRSSVCDSLDTKPW